MFLLYNLILALASVAVIPYYLFRRRRQAKPWAGLARRLAPLEPSLKQTSGGAIWLHAVSVGEVLSCRQLASELRSRFPNARLLVSTATETGYLTAVQKLGRLVDGVFYAPLDLPFLVRRTLEHLQPWLVIVAETEIWPNLFREVKRFGAGLLMVNARISDRSAPRYRRFRFFFRRVLSFPDAILAQSPLDQQRFLEAGAAPGKVEAGGNLKFDTGAVAAAPPVDLTAFLERRKPAAVVLAGSTRAGEEIQVVEAFSQVVAKHPGSLLILAPRHAERFDAVAQLLSQAGYGVVRRSKLRSPSQPPHRILLLDSLGELASLYALADAVFVGGSLVRWGGHNVLEPAFAGRPIVVGPHMQNFRAIADGLADAGGLVQVQDSSGLATALIRLIEDRQQASDIGEKARCYAQSQRGATRRAVDRAEQLYHQAVPSQPPRFWERLLLWLPARAWETVARRRAAAYRQGRRTARSLHTPVVSVGNLTAGGTGKTPIVLWLIERLQARGMSTAVLTRGYRRAAPEPVTVIEPGSAAPPSLTGDEAQLYLRRARVPVGVAADRHAAGVEIERRFHPDLLILDDGFQHYQLARDLDLVLVDVAAPFGRGDLLPLGRLREPLSALAHADVLLLTRCEPGQRWEGLQRELRLHNPGAPILFARTEPLALVDASTGAEKPLVRLAARPVLAFCAVGNPAAFWRTLELATIATAARIPYPDHHRYSPSDASVLLAAARRLNAAALVTTEKDLVNLWHAAGNSDVASLFAPLPLYWLKTRVVVEGGEALVDRIAGLLRPDKAGAMSHSR